MKADDDAHRPESAGLVRPFLDKRIAGTASEENQTMGPALRPFLLTSGRVQATGEPIAIETQVVSTEFGHKAWDRLEFERRDIVALCSAPLAIAEIAARLSLHLGVVRVLVGDLAAEGYLYVYLPNTNASQDVETLLRVINGLRAIS